MVAFTRGEVRDLRVDLSTAESAVNVEVTKDLLYFINNNGRGDEVSSGVTDPSKGVTFSTVFFDVLVCDPLLKLL